MLGSPYSYQTFKLNKTKEMPEAEQDNWESCHFFYHFCYPTYTMRKVLSNTTKTHLHQH